MNAFHEKVALVTGAASGIGEALCVSLAQSGAHVIATDIDEARLKTVVSLIKASGARAEGHLLDVSDQDRFSVIAARVVQDYGRIDFLFNNAGIGPAAKYLICPLRIEAHRGCEHLWCDQWHLGSLPPNGEARWRPHREYRVIGRFGACAWGDRILHEQTRCCWIIDLSSRRGQGLRCSRLGGLPGLHTDSDLRQLDDGKVGQRKVHESTYPWTADAGFEMRSENTSWRRQKTLDHHGDRPRLVGLAAVSSYPCAVQFFAGSFGYEKSTKGFRPQKHAG